MQENGRHISTQTETAQRHLMRHVNRKMHYTSVLYSVRQDRRNMDAEARHRYTQPENKDIRELASIFLTSFTLVKTNTALRGTDSWYKTLKKIGANVGTGKMLHGRTAVMNIVKFISDEGFSRIRAYLVAHQLPFTLILDGASDKTHNHYISMFIQSVEGDTILFWTHSWGQKLYIGKYSPADQKLAKRARRKFRRIFQATNRWNVI